MTKLKSYLLLIIFIHTISFAEDYTDLINSDNSFQHPNQGIINQNQNMINQFQNIINNNQSLSTNDQLNQLIINKTEDMMSSDSENCNITQYWNKSEYEAYQLIQQDFKGITVDGTLSRKSDIQPDRSFYEDIVNRKFYYDQNNFSDCLPIYSNTNNFVNNESTITREYECFNYKENLINCKAKKIIKQIGKEYRDLNLPRWIDDPEVGFRGNVEDVEIDDDGYVSIKWLGSWCSAKPNIYGNHYGDCAGNWRTYASSSGNCKNISLDKINKEPCIESINYAVGKDAYDYHHATFYYIPKQYIEIIDRSECDINPEECEMIYTDSCLNYPKNGCMDITNSYPIKNICENDTISQTSYIYGGITTIENNTIDTKANPITADITKFNALCLEYDEYWNCPLQNSNYIANRCEEYENDDNCVLIESVESEGYKKFRCIETINQLTTEPRVVSYNCNTQEIDCIGIECINVLYDTNNEDLSSVAATYNIMTGMKKTSSLEFQNDENNVKLFPGHLIKCKDYAIPSAPNCCDKNLCPAQVTWIDYALATHQMWKFGEKVGYTEKIMNSSYVQPVTQGWTNMKTTVATKMSEAWQTVSKPVTGFFAETTGAKTAAEVSQIETVKEVTPDVLSKFTSKLCEKSYKMLQSLGMEDFGKNLFTINPDTNAAEGMLSGEEISQKFLGEELGTMVYDVINFLGVVYTAYQVYKLVVAIAFQCDDDDYTLSQNRQMNLCFKINSHKERKLGKTIYNEHTYCCFDTLLGKIINRAGRKQLGINQDNCNALTQNEFKQIDLTKVDFSEWYVIFNNKIVNDLSTAQDTYKNKEYLTNELIQEKINIITKDI